MGKCCRCLPQESFWWDLATNCPAKFYPWASALQNLGPGNGIEKGGPMWGLMGIAWMTPTKTETVWEDMHDHRIFMNILHFTWTCFGMKRPLCDFPYYTVMHISWNGTFRQAASFFPPQLPLLQGVPACWGIMFLCSRELQQWHTHGLPLNHMQSKMGFCNNLSSPHPFHRSEHGWHRFTPLLSLSIPFHLSFGFNSFRFWDLEHERETGSRSTRNAFESLGARVTELGQGAGLLVGIVEWTKLLPKATEGGFL